MDDLSNAVSLGEKLKHADSRFVRDRRSSGKGLEFSVQYSETRQCMPGIESVEVVDDMTYRGKLVVRVGPIKSEFSGKVTLTQVNAPNQIAGTG